MGWLNAYKYLEENLHFFILAKSSSDDLRFAQVTQIVYSEHSTELFLKMCLFLSIFIFFLPALSPASTILQG